MAVKVYEKSSLSASKLRAVKREAAMMIYMTRKRYTASQGHITLSPWEWAGWRPPCLQHEQAPACAVQRLPKPHSLHISLRADRPVTAGSHIVAPAPQSAVDSTGHSKPNRQ